MKTLLAMVQDELLEKLLEHRKKDAEMTISSTKDEFYAHIDKQYDSIVVHCNLFSDVYPWDWLTPIKNIQKFSKVIVIYNEKPYDSTLLEVVFRLSNDFGFTLISGHGSMHDTVSSVVAQLYGKNEVSTSHSGKVITVWSAAPKDGATTIAINSALALAASTELSIGLVDLNLKNPEIRMSLNMPDNGRSNLQIRPRLQTNSLSPNELLSYCLKYGKAKNLHVLAGSNRRDTANDVSPEMVHHLLQTCKQTFDITFIDVNSYPDNAATICAVREAEQRWLVVQNMITSYRTSWAEWYEAYWKYCGLQSSDIGLILNRAVKSGEGTHISSFTNMNVLAEIPNMTGAAGINAVNEGVPLYFQSNNTAYVEAISNLMKYAVGKDSGFLDTGRKRKNLWNRLVASIM